MDTLTTIPLTVPPMWSREGSKFFAAADTVPKLPAGYYKLTLIQGEPCLVANTIISDDLIALPDTATVEVLNEIQRFWELRPSFTARGLLHKRGVLLWGSPGTGKTALVLQMADAIVQDQGGIVVEIDNPIVATHCLSMIRKIEPDRPIVAFLEDFDGLIKRHSADQFLSLLDGENQVDRIVYLATTNYPKQLEKRFTDRPSRFDLIKEIGLPSNEAARAYLLARDPTIENVDLWLNHTRSFTLAYLREFVILVQIYGMSVENAAERLHRMRRGNFTTLDKPSEAHPPESTEILTLEA